MKMRNLFFTPILAMLVVGGLLTGCHNPPPVTPDAVRVTVSKPVPREIRDWDVFTGQVKSKEVVQIKAQVTGKVVAVKFTEGAEIKKGTVLFEIEPDIYAATLKQAKGQLQIRRAEQDYADKEFVRTKELHEKKSITQSEYDKSEAAKEKTKGAVLAAQADVDRAAENLKYCTIKAPITGQVGKAMLTEGNLITEAGVTVMTTIVQMNPIYAEFGVDERALLLYKSNKAKQGKGATASLPALGVTTAGLAIPPSDLVPLFAASLVQDKVLDKTSSIKALNIPVELGLSVEKDFPHVGVLDFADNKVDPNTGTILCRAEFPNADDRLVPGLFAKVRIATSDKYQALLVADRALLTDQSVKYLIVAAIEPKEKYKVKRNDAEVEVSGTEVKDDDFILQGKCKAKRKDVEMGELTGDGLRVIKYGLSKGDRVIVNGVQYARPESWVEVSEEMMPMLTKKTK